MSYDLQKEPGLAKPRPVNELTAGESRLWNYMCKNRRKLCSCPESQAETQHNLRVETKNEHVITATRDGDSDLVVDVGRVEQLRDIASRRFEAEKKIKLQRERRAFRLAAIMLDGEQLGPSVTCCACQLPIDDDESIERGVCPSCWPGVVEATETLSRGVDNAERSL